MIAGDVLLSPSFEALRRPVVDPLVVSDALLEAQVLNVRLDCLTGTVGVLFEFRVAMQMHESNAGVLVATGVEDFRWATETRSTSLTAWNIVGSSVEPEASGLRLRIACYPDADLTLLATSLAFLNCQVSSIADVPPDYTRGDDDLVRSSVPGWQSEIAVVSGSYIRAAR